MYRPTTHPRATDVQTYSDLTHADVSLLTNILRHQSTAHEEHKETTRQLISDLPSHLRSKVPWITTSCSLHSRLNPLPAASILTAFKRIIDVDLPIMAEAIHVRDERDPGSGDTIRLLEDLSALWSHPRSFGQKYGRAPPTGTTHAKKCSSCVLTATSLHPENLIALGSCLIGRIKTSKWKQSKRLFWIEEWLRWVCDDDDDKEDAVQRMWKTGAELRHLRKTIPVDVGSEREYIEGYIREARFAEHSPQCRPLRGPEQAHHVGFVRDVLRGEEVRDGRDGMEDEEVIRESILRVQISSDDAGRPESNRTAQEWVPVEHSRASTPPKSTPSLRSRMTASSRDDLVDHVLPYCAGSRSRATDSEFTNSQSSSSSSRRSDAQLTRLSRVVRSEPFITPAPIHRQKLRPVTIPHTDWYGESAGSEASRREIERRMAVRGSPVLRVGSNGEVKGPYDNVSRASLVSTRAWWRETYDGN